jgi:hypothetical protein
MASSFPKKRQKKGSRSKIGGRIGSNFELFSPMMEQRDADALTFVGLNEKPKSCAKLLICGAKKHSKCIGINYSLTDFV